VEGRRNRKPSRKILDLLESAGQRPVSAIAAAASGTEADTAGPEVCVARPEVTPGDKKRGIAAKRRSVSDGACTGIEEPLYKSVQVRITVDKDG
jgi:hypothetical protein